MKRQNLALTLLFAVLASVPLAFPQSSNPCADSLNAPVGFPFSASACKNFNVSTFTAPAFIDGTGQSYGDPGPNGPNLISLYGPYLNDESLQTYPAAHTHYQKGVDLAANIQPRCKMGDIPAPGTQCFDGQSFYDPAIVFLFIGFSNCDIEICGGNSDAWDGQDTNQFHLAGQPCATQCPNLHNPNPRFPTAWNQVLSHGTDGVIQLSLIYQIYSHTPQPLVGQHVAVFDGALGHQTLDHWDPTAGWYVSHNDCAWDGGNSNDPECNYDRVAAALAYNGYSEAQVQAVFLKASDSFPTCDLKQTYCSGQADAYFAEQYLANILRYLKCCTYDENHFSTGIPRYPNLQQVFITTRTYGGYANVEAQGINGNVNQCLNPEPFAFETGFAIQRAIVAQIKQTFGITSSYPFAGQLDYTVAPWFDWGPYIWANGETKNGAGLFWCNAQNDITCGSNRDFRYGDLNDSTNTYWGDYTHPTANATRKVAGQFLNWLQGGSLLGVQSFSSAWVTPWIGR